jgi:hypothetical protein
MLPIRSTTYVIALTLVSTGCNDSAAVASTAQVTDSAGVQVVTSAGEDRPLNWSLVEVLRVGGEATGPASFTAANRWVAGVDATDHLYVMDRETSELHRFDSSGKHLRTVGRSGSGPGEIEHPAAMSISNDGSITVLDYGKMALVSWDPDGAVLPERRLNFAAMKRFPTGMVRALGDTVLLLASGADSINRVTWLMQLTGSDTLSIDSLKSPQGEMVQLECVGLNIDPLFAPSLSFAVGNGLVASTTQGAYNVSIYRDARLIRIVRRNISPKASVAADANRLYPDGMKISFGGSAPDCVTPAEEVAEKVGMHQTLPVISDVSLAPNGYLWVERFTFEGETPSVDVFDEQGRYLGTLVGHGAPIGFMGDDRVVFGIDDESIGGTLVGIFRLKK